MTPVNEERLGTKKGKTRFSDKRIETGRGNRLLDMDDEDREKEEIERRLG